MFCSLGALATKEEEEDSCDKPTTSRANKKISALKNICELKRPEVYNHFPTYDHKFFYHSYKKIEKKNQFLLQFVKRN